MPLRKTERASDRQKGIGAAVILGVALAGVYLLISRLWVSPGSEWIASRRLGNDTIAINGRLGDSGAVKGPTELLLLHVRCGAAIVELDASSRPANPAGSLDADGRFSIEAKTAFLARITRTGLRASGIALDQAHQDYLVLGFYASDRLLLLLGGNAEPLRISPRGDILNAGELRRTMAVPPALIVTRNPDGGTRAGGGAVAFDRSC